MATLFPVQVEQHHIDAGIVGSLTDCPIALALREMKFGGNDQWIVDNTGAVVDPWDMMFFELDLVGGQFLLDFEESKPVTPCEIRLIDETDYSAEEVSEAGLPSNYERVLDASALMAQTAAVSV